jgi:predicted alpha/beta superfamily hydrolase
MIRKWKIVIPELTGTEKRWAYVYLPTMYRAQPERRFPVLYMFDGHNVFFDSDATYGKSWGLGNYLDFTDTPLIVAAVECNHSPNNGRLSEYSPYTFDDLHFGHVRGRGRTTMEWMTKRFKQEIDRRYPTIPDREHTFIAGSSMGGLMSLYALLEYNHVFSRAAALSPSLWVDPERIHKLIRTANLAPDTVLYMDYGSEELANHNDMLRLFSRTSSLLLERGVMLECRIVPGGNHNEASWERQIPFFMNTLLYDSQTD